MALHWLYGNEDKEGSMNAERKTRMQAKIAASFAAADPTLAAIHKNVVRIKASDGAIGWNVEQGHHRLVRVVYDAKGRSTVTTVAGPMPAAAFLDHIAAIGQPGRGPQEGTT
jgi:hypothetical protein